MRFDTIWLDARLATLAPGRPGLGHRRARRGRRAGRPHRLRGSGGGAADRLGCDRSASRLDGRWITPGLIDCHTHLVYAGDRAHEFELRLAGASYEEIARAGGGIVSTVKATRAASEDELVAATLPRLDRLIAEGVTTIEIKSGYGLDRDDRDAHAARRAAARRASATVDVVTTFLGAHALPPEANGDKERYIDAGLRDDPRARARTARRRGRRLLRGHRLLAGADRARVRGRQGRRAAGQAARRPALQPARRAASPPSTARCRPIISNTPTRTASPRWRAAGTVAVLLPGAFYVLRETQAPPVDAFRRHRRADRDRDRLQSRHLAAHLAAPDHEHGRDPVPADRRRGHRRRHARGGARARPARRDRHARSRASGATSPSGTSSGRPSWSTASASIRCMRGCGEAQ